MTAMTDIITAVGLCLPGVSPLIDLELEIKELRVDFANAFDLDVRKNIVGFPNQIKVLKDLNVLLLVFNTIALITTVASLYFLGFLGTTLGSIAIGVHCLPLVGRVCWWSAISNLKEEKQL